MPRGYARAGWAREGRKVTRFSPSSPRRLRLRWRTMLRAYFAGCLLFVLLVSSCSSSGTQQGTGAGGSPHGGSSTVGSTVASSTGGAGTGTGGTSTAGTGGEAPDGSAEAGPMCTVQNPYG